MEWNTSYAFGFDNETGWGERYFFTYYIESGNRTDVSVITEVIILIATFCTSVLANVTIAVCIFRYPDMKTITNCFVLNLAMADLLFTMSIPIVAYVRVIGSWNLGNATCKFVPYIQFVAGVVLLWTLTLISMDRYSCIVIPPYRSKLTRRETLGFAVGIWTLTAALFSPLLFWFRLLHVKNKNICTLIFPKSSVTSYSLCFVIPLLIFGCVLPMIMLVFYYYKIFKKIISTKNAWAASCVIVSMNEVTDRKHSRRQSEISLSDILTPWHKRFSIAGQPPSSSNGRHGSLSHCEEIRIYKHLKAVRILILNVVVVLIMWIPITIIMVLIVIDGRRPLEDTNYFLRSHHFLVALIIAFFNTLINPVLYGLLSDNFRACIIKLCCCGKRKLNVNNEMKSINVQSSSKERECSAKLSNKQVSLHSLDERTV